MYFSKLKDSKLFDLYCKLTGEMRERGLIRTSNNPVADYGEYIVSQKLKLKLTNNSFKGYDAIDYKKKRYQIKARRQTRHNKSVQLGVIRNIDERPFDFLVAVIFNEDFSIQSIWKIPRVILKKYSSFSKHQNGHILVLRGKILEDSKSVRIL